MNEELKTIVVGMLPKELKGYGNNDRIRRVYGINGIAPAITANGGAIKSLK